jgi:hypothetical protein
MSRSSRASIFQHRDSDTHVEVNLTDDELISVIDILQFAYRMYSIGSAGLREAGDEEKAKLMDEKANMAMEMSMRLIDDGSPGEPRSETDLI